MGTCARAERVTISREGANRGVVASRRFSPGDVVLRAAAAVLSDSRHFTLPLLPRCLRRAQRCSACGHARCCSAAHQRRQPPPSANAQCQLVEASGAWRRCGCWRGCCSPSAPEQRGRVGRRSRTRSLCPTTSLPGVLPVPLALALPPASCLSLPLSFISPWSP